MRKPKRRSGVVEFDPTNPTAIEEAGAEDEREHQSMAEQEKADFLELMGCAWGRRFADRLLEQTHVFTTSFTGEPQSTAFKEGERNIGLWLIAQINDHAPESLALLLKERNA